MKILKYNILGPVPSVNVLCTGLLRRFPRCQCLCARPPDGRSGKVQEKHNIFGKNTIFYENLVSKGKYTSSNGFGTNSRYLFICKIFQSISIITAKKYGALKQGVKKFPWKAPFRGHIIKLVGVHFQIFFT